MYRIEQWAIFVCVYATAPLRANRKTKVIRSSTVADFIRVCVCAFVLVALCWLWTMQTRDYFCWPCVFLCLCVFVWCGEVYSHSGRMCSNKNVHSECIRIFTYIHTYWTTLCSKFHANGQTNKLHGRKMWKQANTKKKVVAILFHRFRVVGTIHFVGVTTEWRNKCTRILCNLVL